MPSIATTILPDVIAGFRAQLPAVEITVRDAEFAKRHRPRAVGVVELGIASLSSERRAISFTPLFDEPLGIVCRKDDPLFLNDGPRRWSAT